MLPDLIPTPHRPGIHIANPDNGTCHAAYACRCGSSRTARGVGPVLALIEDWENHLPKCRTAPAAAKAPTKKAKTTNRQRTTVPAADDEGGLF